MASPTVSSYPCDYTQAHEPKYQELLSYGEYTLRYCFSEFLQGGQTELRGQIMALICQNIMLAEAGADGEHGGGIEMANKIVREIIHAKGIDIGIYTKDFENEYISLTDIAKYRNDNDPRFVIQNWMRNRNTVEFLAVWEELHNPDFNRVQFEAVRSEAGLNRFVMTPTKWIEQTNAIGIVSKAGRYGGGTYAHSDIAMAFATWISPEFQLYIMKDYRRLKQDENSRLSLDWKYGGESVWSCNGGYFTHSIIFRDIVKKFNKSKEM